MGDIGAAVRVLRAFDCRSFDKEVAAARSHANNVARAARHGGKTLCANPYTARALLARERADEYRFWTAEQRRADREIRMASTEGEWEESEDPPECG